MATTAESRHDPGHRGCCPRSLCCFTLPGPLREVRKRLEGALYRSGFELLRGVSLSGLAKERLGIESTEMEALYLNHPVLLLQCLFTGGDAELLFPFVAVLRSCARSTHLCICSAWSEDGIGTTALSRHLLNQTKEWLKHAAADFGRTR